MEPDPFMDRATIQTVLKRYICEDLLRRPDYPLGEDEPLITGGLIDSFSLAQIGVFVEKTFNVYIPDTELTVDEFDTLEQMATQVLAHTEHQD